MIILYPFHVKHMSRALILFSHDGKKCTMIKLLNLGLDISKLCIAVPSLKVWFEIISDTTQAAILLFYVTKWHR